ncbi:Ubiquitin, partial [Perkinsus chesapeaki]
EVLYGDKALDGDGPLSELVTSRIDISAQLRLKGYVKVFVETQTAQAFVCHMLSSDTVIDLKREIKIASGITEEYQDLTYNGLEMADENSLRACFGDGHLDHYAVFLSHGDFLRVEVDGGASGKATVYVKNSDTVVSLKTKLHLEGGRHKDARVLYHNGKEMKDGESLRLFNPNGDFVIRLTMKLQMMHVNLHDVADNKIFAITLPKTSS